MRNCIICGKEIKDDEWEICEDCREKAKTFDNSYSMGNSWREDVSINGFWQHCFSQQDIDDILYCHFMSLPEEEQKRLVDSFFYYDTLFFVRWIEKKWKKQKSYI